MRLSSSKATTGEFRTLQGGHTLRIPVEHNELLPLNKPCFLAIRPEHVIINKTNEPAENSIRGQVREINFAGATSSVRLDANGLILEALVLRPDGLVIGNDYTVGLPPQWLSLLKNE
jgi:ABC-type Fe3+/spermidine/putrescine transport system ATPase subunit